MSFHLTIISCNTKKDISYKERGQEENNGRDVNTQNDKQGCTQMLHYRSSILSSFVTYYQDSNKSNTRCATYGAGHAYPVGASAFIPVFDGIRDFM